MYHFMQFLKILFNWRKIKIQLFYNIDPSDNNNNMVVEDRVDRDNLPIPPEPENVNVFT